MRERTLITTVLAYWAAFKELVTGHWAWLDADQWEHLATKQDRGQVSTIVTVVVLGIVALVGILIFDEVDSAIGDPTNSGLSNSQSNVTDGFGDSMDLVPIVLLVLIASLVIAVVQQF